MQGASGSVQPFLQCVSVCHFCQLRSVFDSLLAAIFSQGKSFPATPRSSYRWYLSFSPLPPPGYVMSHSAPPFWKALVVNLPLLCNIPQRLCCLLLGHPSPPPSFLQNLRGFPYIPDTCALTYSIAYITVIVSLRIGWGYKRNLEIYQVRVREFVTPSGKGHRRAGNIWGRVLTPPTFPQEKSN